MREAGEAFASNARNPALRRVQLASLFGWTAEWAFTTALAIIAFADGGAAAVGVIAVLRMLPAALLGPFAGAVADRMPKDRVLVLVGALRAAAIGAAAACLVAGAPLPVVYALAIAASIVFVVYRPAFCALLPVLSTTPKELMSANIVRGMLDGIAVLAGPLLGALVLDAASPAAALWATAACAAVGAAIAWRLPYEAADAGGGATAGGRRVARVLADTAEGVRALRRSAAARLLVGLGCVQTFIRGAFNVFLVVVAIDLLETGEAGVGVLSSALGVGGVVGAFGASLLAGSRALARVFAVGVALWGIPLIVIAGLPVNAAALAMVAVIGIANALIDVAFFTLLGRLADEVVLARVLGLAEMLFALAIGLGSIAAPLAIAAAGASGALALVGLLGPVPALLAWRALGRIDDTLAVRSDVISVLQTVPLLRPLPVPAIERLAEAAVHEAVPAGATVFSEGDQGDRFYVIHAGEADVYGNGRHIRVMAPGDGFGEIALLRDLPRTATVSARSDLDLYSLCRDQFVPAVTNLRSSACAAAGLIEARLTTYPGPVTAA